MTFNFFLFLKKLVHFLKREIAGSVSVHHKDALGVSAADEISKVVDATACSQTLVLLQVSIRMNLKFI